MCFALFVEEGSVSEKKSHNGKVVQEMVSIKVVKESQETMLLKCTK